MKQESDRERLQTVRQEIVDLLMAKEMNARDISQEVSIREKDVYKHLDHIARTAVTHGQKLVVRPSCCYDCGFVFSERSRLTRPGRCPQCKKSHIAPPVFTIGQR
ncbi:MAG: transcriptional regulator [Proteobacteria bacterium]|nr:transcriptional regulator [Pseudomonadota bacterium]MBU1710722.1 transcriptional regulator [Pseudomonadota bacterium]